MSRNGSPTLRRVESADVTPQPAADPTAEFSRRLGRRVIRTPAAKAQRLKVLETCERLKRECPPSDWRRKLAESILADGLADPDDFEDAYTSGEFSR